VISTIFAAGKDEMGGNGHEAVESWVGLLFRTCARENQKLTQDSNKESEGVSTFRRLGAIHQRGKSLQKILSGCGQNVNLRPLKMRRGKKTRKSEISREGAGNPKTEWRRSNGCLPSLC